MNHGRNKTTDKMKNKEDIAIAVWCRQYLYFNYLLSEAENDKVHKRISKDQDKGKIGVTEEDLDSVGLIYKSTKDKRHG